MNYEEKLQRLKTWRKIADQQVEIIELVKRRVHEQHLDRLTSSQKRVLSAALAQGRNPQERIESLKRFFDEAKKRGREGRGWREGERLEAVERDIDDLLGKATTEIEKDTLITYYVHYLEAWAILKSEWKEGAQCGKDISSQEP